MPENFFTWTPIPDRPWGIQAKAQVYDHQCKATITATTPHSWRAEVTVDALQVLLPPYKSLDAAAHAALKEAQNMIGTADQRSRHDARIDAEIRQSIATFLQSTRSAHEGPNKPR